MVKTASTMLELGSPALPFSLPRTCGKTVSLSDFQDSKGVLLMFICNHCPFVKHIANELASLGENYARQGITVIGINSNDVKKYPDDSFEAMKIEVQKRGYTFPYLLDEDQQVAKAYRAACTPDFFLFDGDQRLVYRGQLDDSRPNSEIPITGSDLRGAMDSLLAGRELPVEQTPSIGCNIKWQPGNEPDYFIAAGIG